MSIRSSCELETYIVGVERIKEYSELENEACLYAYVMFTAFGSNCVTVTVIIYMVPLQERHIMTSIPFMQSIGYICLQTDIYYVYMGNGLAVIHTYMACQLDN